LYISFKYFEHPKLDLYLFLLCFNHRVELVNCTKLGIRLYNLFIIYLYYILHRKSIREENRLLQDVW